MLVQKASLAGMIVNSNANNCYIIVLIISPYHS